MVTNLLETTAYVVWSKRITHILKNHQGLTWNPIITKWLRSHNPTETESPKWGKNVIITQTETLLKIKPSQHNLLQNHVLPLFHHHSPIHQKVSVALYLQLYCHMTLLLLYIYTSLFHPVATKSALQYCITFTHSCTHSHTDGGVNHARRQPAGEEQSGWGVCSRTPRRSARRSRGSN